MPSRRNLPASYSHASQPPPGVRDRLGRIQPGQVVAAEPNHVGRANQPFEPLPVGPAVGDDRRTHVGVDRPGWAMLGPGPVSYTCLPLFHTNALKLTTYRALVMGRPVVLSRRFSASGFWDEIRRYGATTFKALGAMIPILMKQPPRPEDADNPVTVVFSAACPVSVWAAFEERFALRIYEGYAAVDGGGYTVINLGQSPRGSIGRPAGGYRIVDDDGHDVAVGEPGELIFEIIDLEAGRVEYYKDEAATRAKVEGGWFHTGDLVRADEAGNLYFVDRKTDSLRRRGENISSWEVERELDTHPPCSNPRRSVCRPSSARTMSWPSWR